MLLNSKKGGQLLAGFFTPADRQERPRHRGRRRPIHRPMFFRCCRPLCCDHGTTIDHIDNTAAQRYITQRKKRIISMRRRPSPETVEPDLVSYGVGGIKAAVKKGDVVWMERWGGVIGIVVSYENQTLMLKQPLGTMTFNFIQPFNPVRPEEITVLNTPEQVFSQMKKLFNERLVLMRNTLSLMIKERVTEYKL